MEVWQQVYDPFNSIWLSAAVAFLPIACFLACLLVFKMKGYQAGFLTVVLASVLAVFAYDMPFSLVGASFVQGFAQILLLQRQFYCDFKSFRVFRF